VRLAAALAEYKAQRDRTPLTAEAQWKLALWCERKGLKPESVGHLTTVTRLDPDRAPTWERLGYKKQGDRWVSEVQLNAERAEAKAQKEADRYWEPRLVSWIRHRYRPDWQKDEVERESATVTDPRAVPAICRVCFHGMPGQRALGIQLLGQSDAPVSTRRLAALAVFSKSDAVRRSALDVLRQRDPRDVVEALLDLMKDPLQYEIGHRRGSSDRSVLIEEGESFRLNR
jgi:hypothetical protein